MNVSFHIGESRTVLISSIQTKFDLELVLSLINKSNLIYTDLDIHSYKDAETDIFSVTILLPNVVAGKPYANFDSLVREQSYQQWKLDMMDSFSIPEKQFLTVDEAEAREAVNNKSKRHRFMSAERSLPLPTIKSCDDESASPRPF